MEQLELNLTKETYSAPKLAVIQLFTEEVVMCACKNYSHGGPGHNSCFSHCGNCSDCGS